MTHYVDFSPLAGHGWSAIDSFEGAVPRVMYFGRVICDFDAPKWVKEIKNLRIEKAEGTVETKIDKDTLIIRGDPLNQFDELYANPMSNENLDTYTFHRITIAIKGRKVKTWFSSSRSAYDD